MERQRFTPLCYSFNKTLTNKMKRIYYTTQIKFQRVASCKEWKLCAASFFCALISLWSLWTLPENVWNSNLRYAACISTGLILQRGTGWAFIYLILFYFSISAGLADAPSGPRQPFSLRLRVSSAYDWSHRCRSVSAASPWKALGGDACGGYKAGWI